MVNSMIRKKHIIIFTALLSGILVGILLTLIFFPAGTVSLQQEDLSLLPPDNYTQPVSVAVGAGTDSIRTALIEKLRAIGPHALAPIVVEEEPSEPTPPPRGRTFEVTASDGGQHTVTIPETGTYDGKIRELVSPLVGISFYGTWIKNNESALYGGNDGSHVLVGYALDGFAIYADVGATDLDQCHGHASDLSGIYHYHVTGESVLGCFSSEPVDVSAYSN